MANEQVEQHYKAILRGLTTVLDPYGFTKRGNAYRRLSGGNSAVVEVQRSQSSSGDVIRFTINVGVVCGRLLYDFQPDVTKAGTMDAHLRERIGTFTSERVDKWWVIDAATKPDALAAEIGAVLPSAVTFILNHLNASQLIALWETGASPGITDGQRQRYLSELRVMG